MQKIEEMNAKLLYDVSQSTWSAKLNPVCPEDVI